MKFYVKPTLTIEALTSEETIASDKSTLGLLDPIEDEDELSIPAPNWGDLLT